MEKPFSRSLSDLKRLVVGTTYPSLEESRKVSSDEIDGTDDEFDVDEGKEKETYPSAWKEFCRQNPNSPKCKQHAFVIKTKEIK